MEEFHVSRSSIREALRILETEGLVTVKRGKFGGAVVHAPNTHNAAHPLGVILQSLGVPLADLAGALQALEPTCVKLCALRADRMTTVVPRLNEILAETSVNLDDESKALRYSREFHETIVSGCGNQTLITVIGALKAIWFVHELDWTDRLLGRFDAPQRRFGLAQHERIANAIESGSADKAYRLMWSHMTGGPGASSSQLRSDAKIHRYIGVRDASPDERGG
jgi:DNA-binding FadR family transcriptional regulator